MQIPAFKADLPFDQEDANRYLPWIIAVMTALTTFMLALGLSFSGFFMDYHSDFEYRMQIQVPYADGEEQGQAEAILERLSKIEGIERAAPVSSSAMQDILSPWLGGTDVIDLLPVPKVIDVWMEPDAYDAGTVNAATVHDALKTSYPTIVVDDYRAWVKDFNAITNTVKRIAYGLGSIMLLAAVIVVLLITRASVQLHFPIVRLLHRMGAQDHYITKQFQVNAAVLTLKGAFFGVIAAAIFYYILSAVVGGMNIPIMPDTLLSGLHAVLFLLLPLLMSMVVAGATYLNVLGMLRRLH